MDLEDREVSVCLGPTIFGKSHFLEHLFVLIFTLFDAPDVPSEAVNRGLAGKAETKSRTYFPKI